MSEGVLIAIITGVCAVFGQWLISRNQSAKRKVDDAVRDARLDDRLAGVEKRLDEHNHYASKIGSIQTDIAVIKVQRGVRASGSYQEGTGKSGCFAMWKHPRGHVWNVVVRPASS